MNEDQKKSILRHVENDILANETGFYVFWPSRTSGYYTSSILRVIADRLDELNEPYEREIQEYFNAKTKEEMGRGE